MSESVVKIEVRAETEVDEVIPAEPNPTICTKIEETPSLLICTTCARQVASVDLLREHVSAYHLYYFPYQCSQCKNTLASMELLKEHFFRRNHPEQVNEILDREKEEELALLIKHMLSNQDSVRIPANVPIKVVAEMLPASSTVPTPGAGSNAAGWLPGSSGIENRKRKADPNQPGDYGGINIVDLNSLYKEFADRQIDLNLAVISGRKSVDEYVEEYVNLVMNRIYGESLKHCTKKQKYVKKLICVPTKLADDIYVVLEKEAVDVHFKKCHQREPVHKQDMKSFIHSAIDREIGRAKRR